MSAAPQARPRDPPPHSDRKYTVSHPADMHLNSLLTIGASTGGNSRCNTFATPPKSTQKGKEKTKESRFLQTKKPGATTDLQEGMRRSPIDPLLRWRCADALSGRQSPRSVVHVTGHTTSSRRPRVPRIAPPLSKASGPRPPTRLSFCRALRAPATCSRVNRA
jgi:hypothetical protein